MGLCCSNQCDQDDNRNTVKRPLEMERGSFKTLDGTMMLWFVSFLNGLQILQTLLSPFVEYLTLIPSTALKKQQTSLRLKSDIRVFCKCCPLWVRGQSLKWVIFYLCLRLSMHHWNTLNRDTGATHITSLILPLFQISTNSKAEERPSRVLLAVRKTPKWHIHTVAQPKWP